MSILDMISTDLNTTDDSVHSYSNLDHVVGKTTVKYEQSYGYNCGIFIIMTMIMRCHDKQRFLQDKYTKDNPMKCRIRLLNLIIDAFRVIISKNTFRYDVYRISATERDHFFQGWRNNYLASGKPGYDYKKRFQNMAVDETLPKNKKINRISLIMMKVDE